MQVAVWLFASDGQTWEGMVMTTKTYFTIISIVGIVFGVGIPARPWRNSV